MQTREKVSADDLQKIRTAGFSNANIVEIIALSATYMLTNFINNAFDTETDFPVVNPEVA
jgi:alkylhydroperoxidase family enzyme